MPNEGPSQKSSPSTARWLDAELRIWMSGKSTRRPSSENRPAMPLMNALMSRQDGIEQQTKSRERLGAMLRAKSDEHDAARADRRLHDGRAPGDHRFALEPAAEQNVFRTVSRDCLDWRRSQVAAMARARRRAGNLVRRAEREESRGARGHAVRDRLRGVELDAHDRTGAEEPVAARFVRHVAHRQLEEIDREPARLIQADERPAGLDEGLQRLNALMPASPRILGRPDPGRLPG